MSSDASSRSVGSNRTPKSNAASNNEEEESGRISKFATCVRQVAATVPFKKKQLFNAPEYDPVAMAPMIHRMSGKFNTLVKTIRELDEKDMKEHNTMFKHFIFTDLRKGAYGAKAIASFLNVHGFELVFRTEKGFRRRKMKGENGKPILDEKKKPVYKMEETKKAKIVMNDLEPFKGGSNRVGILQSAPLWKSQLSVELRKKMLSIFNSRPANIHGEKLRIMVLDSKFKEGIDLYDVKYVHLMEPQITEADLKQAVGRATRFCGQRGLQFVPNVGWKLNVYMYNTDFASGYPFQKEGKKDMFDAHTFMLAHSGLDLGLLEMTRNLTILGIQSAVDYDLTYKINNFRIHTQIHDMTSLKEAIVAEVTQTGGVRVYPDASKIKMEKCATKANKFFPFTSPELKDALKKAGIKVPSTANRKWLCEHVTKDIVLQLLEEMKARGEEGKKDSRISEENKVEDEREVDVQNSSASKKPTPPASSGSITSIQGVTPVTPYQTLFPMPERKPLTKKEIDELPDLGEFFRAVEAKAAFEAAGKLSFAEFQAFVMDTYKRFGWESPVVQSACETAPIPGKAVQFSQSQDFVRHYLTPSSPFKGLLAWHSVGTGKTCTAVATASTEFEKDGYSILWVTRNSLMADVWKNMFGAVCSIPVQEHLAKGKKMPLKLGSQKRLISKYWFDPISYKALQNALVPMTRTNKETGVTRVIGVNKLGKALQERNGKADPLRKTFLIIDEVHKLLDGDLKKSEQANFDLIEQAIHHSYATSGKDSVKVLLMTATPITDKPEGLFRLLNLLIPVAKNRFPDAATFREKFTNEKGEITPSGIRMFKERTKGLISYLNREFDPSAFAQPNFINLNIEATGALHKSDEALIQECQAADNEEELEVADCNVDELKLELTVALNQLEADETMKKKDKAERKRTLKAESKTAVEECKKRHKTRKAQLKDRQKKYLTCVANAAKTRKKDWSMSQQKAAKSCFGKDPHGTAPTFTGVADLKRMARNFTVKSQKLNVVDEEEEEEEVEGGELMFNKLFHGMPVTMKFDFDEANLNKEELLMPSKLRKVKLPYMGRYKVVDFTGTTNEQALKKLLAFYSKPAVADALGDHIYFEGFFKMPNGVYIPRFGS
jgi:hypothetical protein